MINSIKKLRNLAAVPVIAALAMMIPMASPAHADIAGTGIVGAGVASGFVHGNGGATIACTPGAGYTFSGVAITGASIGASGLPAVGTTGFTALNQPAGRATGDPLDGTPLGCRNGDIAPTVDGLGIIPPGTPLVGCPTATCPGGVGTSNVLADEGTVVGATNGTNFICAPGTSVPNFVVCSLHGSFVRYGGLGLVFLNGCVDTSNSATTCTGTGQDVAVAFHIAVLPLDSGCSTVDPTFKCDAFAGPFVITNHGTVTGSGGTVQTVLDTVYCPVGGRPAPSSLGNYPPTPDCQ